jgi:hypothetical protein
VAGWGCEIMSTSSWPNGEMPVFGQLICAGCGDRFETPYGEFDIPDGLTEEQFVLAETLRVGWQYMLEDDGRRRGWFCGSCFNALGHGGGPKRGA